MLKKWTMGNGQWEMDSFLVLPALKKALIGISD
jgi:hypothetical protein